MYNLVNMQVRITLIQDGTAILHAINTACHLTTPETMRVRIPGLSRGQNGPSVIIWVRVPFKNLMQP